MKPFTLLFVCAIALISACSEPKPVPILYGQDMGEYCGMIISDNRFGAEIITTKRKVYKFDSVESMIAYKLENLQSEDVHSYWVTDFANPGTLIPAESAYYLKAEKIHSPMGLGLVAFANEADALRIQQEDSDAFTTFDGLEALVMTADFLKQSAATKHEHEVEP
jgi:copper chaperone NosL